MDIRIKSLDGNSKSNDGNFKSLIVIKAHLEIKGWEIEMLFNLKINYFSASQRVSLPAKNMERQACQNLSQARLPAKAEEGGLDKGNNNKNGYLQIKDYSIFENPTFW